MADINATLPLIEPLATTINSLMNTVKIFVGGFFGLYVIIFIYKIFTFRKLNKGMKILLDEMEEVKKRLDKIEKKSKK